MTLLVPRALATLEIVAVVVLSGTLAGCAHESAASPAAGAIESRKTAAVPPSVGKVESPATAPQPTAKMPAAEPSTNTPTSAAESSAPAEDTPPPRRGKAPPADRGPSRPGDAEKITFEDLILGMQADVVFRPFMLTERAQELEGQRVSIVGYMHGAVESITKAKEFVLLRNTECKFGPGGQADHLAQVYLKQGQTIGYQLEAVKVEGTLKVEPYQGTDGNTWAIYRLEDAQIK